MRGKKREGEEGEDGRDEGEILVLLSQPNGQTYILEFWHGGQVEGYLGQV